ncbi:hypothetical protein N8289_03835 [Flavobacteriales bacterium]|nr:hypothetical protein [Flavobacteriales bacterium]
MATIQYQKTYFNPPSKINEPTFLALKSEFNRNHNFVIDKDFETFSEHFKTNLRVIGISFFLFLFCFGVFEDGNPMIAVGGISMVTFFFSCIFLLLEGRSYATYAKKRKEYYDRMTYAISISSTYNEYIQNFYGKK